VSRRLTRVLAFFFAGSPKNRGNCLTGSRSQFYNRVREVIMAISNFDPMSVRAMDPSQFPQHAGPAGSNLGGVFIWPTMGDAA
jgi:hypothetical protein